MKDALSLYDYWTIFSSSQLQEYTVVMLIHNTNVGQIHYEAFIYFIQWVMDRRALKSICSLKVMAAEPLLW